MWEDNRGLTFSLDSYELYFGQKQWFKLKHPSNDWLQTQLFISQDVNWWTGVVSITCGLMWCFYQLFRLILMAPIHPLLHFSKSDPMKQTHLHLGWPEGECTVSKFTFGVKYSFKEACGYTTYWLLLLIFQVNNQFRIEMYVYIKKLWNVSSWNYFEICKCNSCIFYIKTFLYFK